MWFVYYCLRIVASEQYEYIQGRCRAELAGALDGVRWARFGHERRRASHDPNSYENLFQIRCKIHILELPGGPGRGLSARSRLEQGS